MKMNLNKIRILSLILFISLTTLSFPSGAKEYILFAESGTQTDLYNNNINVFPGDTIFFRILDNTTKKYVTTGNIKIDNETIPIVQSSLTEEIKDRIALGISNDTWGNNIEYYAKKTFKETAEDYTKVVTGYIENTKTNNSIKVYVKSNYEYIMITDMNNLKLKYNKSYKDEIDKLNKSIHNFTISSHELQKKMNKLNNKPTKKDIEDLESLVDKVIIYRNKIHSSVKDIKSKSGEKLIKESLFKQLDQIDSYINDTITELTKKLNENGSLLLEKEKGMAKEKEDDKKKELSKLKSKLRKEVFIPAGLFVVFGLITGYFIVNRWKKESEYLGLITSNVEVRSPMTIATIITILILIIILVIVYQYGDFAMFKYLIGW